MNTNFFRILLLSFFSSMIIMGCRQEAFENEVPKTENKKVTEKVTLGAYQSDLPYNLNVVYFIPSDVSARPEYERRVSEFVLAAQEYFRQNIYNWGYGNQTFGLLKDPQTNRIKINVVYGQKPMSSYPYSAGDQILSEVNAWFAAHPADKTSDHTLIFTATPSINTEIPYYGLGRNCFVGDNEYNDYQYVNQNSPQGNQAKAYMGGFLHELGHGLGLPHDALPKSLQNVPGYGTSLMSWGNQTYGYSSTILTRAAASILNNSQVFSPVLKPAGYFYNQNHSMQVALTQRSVANGRVYASGNYSAGSPINSLTYYFMPKDAPYHAVSSVATTTATNGNFSTYIDLNDLYLTDREYFLVVQAQFVDGGSGWQTFPLFSFDNGVARLDINRSSWTVSSSSQYSAYPASLAIDGNVNTYWHSNYASGSVQTDPIPGQPQNFPYYFDINMGSIIGTSGLSFVQHQGLVRTAKNFSVWTRQTTSDGWQYQGNYDLTNTTNKQYIAFPQKINARYIRITFNSSYDGLPYVAMPEIGAYE